MSGFPTVFGRGLVDELARFVHSPYLVVTMSDLWPLIESQLSDGLGALHLVETLERDALDQIVEELPAVDAVIGVGGGRAVDVAKYVSWRRRLPLFQVPTAMTVNAPFGHRAGIRVDGAVRYVGWAIPEAVYVDFDLIQTAPPSLNRSGVGDILCYHTAHRDWEIARDEGRCESQWPYDEAMVSAARRRLQAVLDHLDDIREVNETGIRVLMGAHRWGGSTFHDSGWNPRHIEGVEHFFFYNLERVTGRHFIHGQPVGLGVFLGSLLQDNDAEMILDVLFRVGVDIRPEAMGTSWEAVTEALVTLPRFVRDAGLWFTVADTAPITPDIVDAARHAIEDRYR